MANLTIPALLDLLLSDDDGSGGGGDQIHVVADRKSASLSTVGKVLTLTSFFGRSSRRIQRRRYVPPTATDDHPSVYFI